MAGIARWSSWQSRHACHGELFRLKYTHNDQAPSFDIIDQAPSFDIVDQAPSFDIIGRRKASIVPNHSSTVPRDKGGI